MHFLEDCVGRLLLVVEPNRSIKHILDFFLKNKINTSVPNYYDDILIIDGIKLLGKYKILDLINLASIKLTPSQLLISGVMTGIGEDIQLEKDIFAISKLILKHQLKCIPCMDCNQKFKILTLENIIDQLTYYLEIAKGDISLEKQYNLSLQSSLNNIKDNLEISIKPHIRELINANKKLQQGICDRIASEAHLLQTNSELQEIFQAFPDVYIRVDIQGKILSYQGNTNNIFLNKTEIIFHKNLEEVLPLEVAQTFSEKIHYACMSNSSTTLEYSMTVAEIFKYFEARLFPSIHHQVIIIIREITEQKCSQISLQKAKEDLEDRVKIRTHELHEINHILRQEITERSLIEKRYARAIHAGKVGAWEWDINSDQIYIDPHLKIMLGYQEDTKMNDLKSWLNLIHPDDVQLVKTKFNDCIEGLISQYEIEHRIFNKDDEILWFLARGTILKDNDKKLYLIVGSNTDITEKKQYENKLKRSLREKEVLLKEIHHRVKNNLQIISSLLRLQANHIPDKQSLGIFRDSQSRIRAMAMIHENLYQSNDLERIDFYNYVFNLTNYISRCYGMSKDIKITLDIENILLRIDTAIPCGLIINELVSNSIKHAFVEQSGGNIHIQFNKINDHKYSISVSDNGIGVSEDSEIRLSQSMGLQLVWNLVEQLEGSITFNTKFGTIFTIMFVEHN
ncbi:histidine kinase dimerization/phosphoacceptor domain -containing protein [Calothrix sp. PCC 6303]|uniref:histidine kinase dimerization/phosphoacceptor domain -containing protein n=1 Tax=Calothrix sp. PCC 6303 TaxID=1170562 RepID=UPI0002A05856|nr:histidine kinase dimerization/phosphoacceptor domain -containing protein [Calothrix sp. PCC 6303]AFY99204.1 signal transduction histidine kinase [Calothrix sp. PCC 6303]